MSRRKNKNRIAANAQVQHKPGKRQAAATVSQRRASAALREQANPLSAFGPDYLRSVLDEYRRGYIRRAAVLWDVMEEYDTTLGTVAEKRKGAVARLSWTINKVDDTPEAKRHAEVLTHFFNHITATDVLREDLRGGMPVLIKQMMDALSKGYAVHEIVWKWTPKGYTADCRFCPLWFFEATEGRLRYLPNSGALTGEEMADGQWMVTVSKPLMVSCAVMYLFKRLPLGDWLVYCGQQGLPGFIGKTNAEPDSPEWDDFADALAALRDDLIALTSEGNAIDKIELGMSGTLPWEPLVKYADQQMTIRWRGADLSTISQKDNTGASLQQSESDILTDDDASMISDVLQKQLARRVLEYTFGRDVVPLAYIELETPDRQDDTAKVNLIKGAQSLGVPVGKTWTREQLSIPEPKDDEDTLVPPARPGLGELLQLPQAANASPVTDDVRRAAAEDMQPLIAMLTKLEALAASGALTPEYLQAQLDQMPQLAEAILSSDGLQRAFLDQMSDASADGVLSAAKLRPVAPQN